MNSVRNSKVKIQIIYVLFLHLTGIKTHARLNRHIFMICMYIKANLRTNETLYKLLSKILRVERNRPELLRLEGLPSLEFSTNSTHFGAWTKKISKKQKHDISRIRVQSKVHNSETSASSLSCFERSM